ncbi:nucleotidyl transferase AbiEii/AbiGii toxin family protein, partial [Mesorhizobium sp. B2-4-15]|uniref:nucleotidyl transferase AbiEii/AbiGii toxin family protein n=1 Tax=Mesorhizobium sp. B2-4-15 TaxID=2589934 RepID=UPI002484B1E2
GIIRRFSEDIDLSFDRADLGYTGGRDPEKKGISRKKSGQLIDDLVGDVEKHIPDRLLPALRAAIVPELGEPKHDGWSLVIDEADAQSLNFHYPVALPTAEYQGMAYITPRVRLELGARGDPWPAEQKVIRPCAAEDFPDFFEDPDTTVTGPVCTAHLLGKSHCLARRSPSSGRVGHPAIFLAPLLRPRHDA